MDKYENLVNDGQFSELTLNVSKYPKSLHHWEILINHLINSASPINKAIDSNLYSLLVSTYESLLFNFPYLENYHIDYALLEYKLGNISKVHKIFRRGLQNLNQRSLLIWLSYLRICNEVIIDHKQLFKKYEMAEKYIGLHYYSSEFWELYLDQLKLRCKSKIRYFIVLRKVLEIPLHSFSNLYALWLQHIEDIKDLSELQLFVSKDDLASKLKIDINYQGRRGPYLLESKKLMRKFTKELYIVVQAQVLERYTLFESKFTIQYYGSAETLIPSKEIQTWLKYLDFIIDLDISDLVHLTFHRALIPLANYDVIWIKYSKWLLENEDNYITAKEILTKGLTISLKKVNILQLLYSILVKYNGLDTLGAILRLVDKSFYENIEDSDDFDIFWDYIQYQIFLNNSILKSRYSNNREETLLPDSIINKIKKRLLVTDTDDNQETILDTLLKLQSKENTHLIENEIFKYLIDSKVEHYSNNGIFWSKYCQLIFHDPSKSYLEKRRYIIENIWEKLPKRKTISETVLEFGRSYMPEDIDILEDRLV